MTLAASSRRLSTAIGLAAGLVVALGWFGLLTALPLGERLRGDAVGYLRIALGFPGLGEALAYVGERSVGFPLFLYCLKQCYLLVHPGGDVAGLVDFIALALLGTHVAASLLFFFAFRGYAERRGVELHWALGAILLAYPGLIGYTTTPLTDTFCADLVMAGFAAAAWAADRAGRGKWMAAAAGGFLLGFAVLCRPSFEPAAVLAIVAWLVAPVVLPLPTRAAWREVLYGRVASASTGAAALFALGFAACLIPAQWHCSERFGSRCLMDKRHLERELPPILRIGGYSPRLYWSRHADPVEPGCGGGCRALHDELLAATWAVSCHPAPEAFGYGFPGCFLRRPDLGALFLAKKTLALFDSYHFQPYAVDQTPRWARLWSRPFGAAAYAGFVFAFLLLAAALRDPRRRELAGLATFTVVVVLVHSLVHIEGRFSNGAVPGALLSLFWLLGTTHAGPGRRRALRTAAVLLAVAFLVQTALWDRADTVLQKIESALQ